MSSGRTTPATDLTFRVLFTAIFVVAGLGHLLRPAAMVERLLAAPLAPLATAVAPAPVLIALTGVVLLLGGTALLLGFWTRGAALALIVVLVPITVVVDLGDPQQIGPLFKNVALLGGLIHFLADGPGACALDAWLHSGRTAARRT